MSEEQQEIYEEPKVVYSFDEFFNTNHSVPEYELTPPPKAWVAEVKADFEQFLNETQMGQDFGAQLREVRDGYGKKEGIGKINFVKGSKNTYQLKGWSENEDDFYAYAYTAGGKDKLLIAFGDNVDNIIVIDLKGKQYCYTRIETFLHELKHIVDDAYMGLSGRKTELSEFDAIVFANAARQELHKIQDKENFIGRDPNIYYHDEDIVSGKSDYSIISQDGEISNLARIMREQEIIPLEQSALGRMVKGLASQSADTDKALTTSIEPDDKVVALSNGSKKQVAAGVSSRDKN